VLPQWVSEPTHIVVRNAREHNLVGVDLDLPRNKMVVFTGVSGSGKSSLAHDTLYKEGQRRFVESLSAYARQFLGRMERPAVDLVDGISPTLSIDQKTTNRNPRSTVGTVTEIYDHIRLLMARLGTPHCPVCGTEVRKLGVDQVVDHLMLTLGSRVQVLGPVVRDRKGEYRKELDELRRDGWVRARIDGEIRGLDEEVSLARYEKHTIEVVVDRLKLGASHRLRLAEALETALSLGSGVAVVLRDDEELVFSTDRACPQHPEVSIPELEPRLFSFNAPQGACETCNGLGSINGFDERKIVDFGARLKDCYLAFNDEGRVSFSHFDRDALNRVAKKLGGPLRKKVGDWPASVRDRLLHGDDSVTYTVDVQKGTRSEKREYPWRGLVGLVKRIDKFTSHKGFDKFRITRACESCGGRRLNAVSLAVTFRGHTIHQLATQSVGVAAAFYRGLELNGEEREIGELLVAEVRDRLAFLDQVGLGYLTLNRSAATLSGGEAQRIRLAAQVGSSLEGVTYVLDEPSIGLHPRDNRRLISALHRLRDRGNSVLVVEHDTETILAADWVVDVGPGAGREGGEIMASATPRNFLRNKRSLTAAYLRGEKQILMPAARRVPTGWLTIRGAKKNNLSGIDARIPLSVLTVITGVSGSGKSTLVLQVFERSLRRVLAGDAPVHCDGLDGVERVDKLIRINQQPIGRTPRSNPATYTKAFDPIRTLFAATVEARARGYKKGRFSFNVAGGRCATCEGAGVITVEMQFLPDVAVTCEVCQGRRFNRETLEITYKGKTVHDVLQMTVDEALAFFGPVPKLARIFGTMAEVGLGYVPIGQASTTLSGGEAQRVKLATELHRPGTGQTVYVLDEPTTGLHVHDVAKLLGALDRLVNNGNTVIVVEHHTDVIKCADHLIDMGPDGGDGGGLVVGQGTPEHVATLPTPTGVALAELPELGAPIAGEPLPDLRLKSKRTTARGIEIVGARKHNLSGVNVSIPHNRLTVITGPSGSGKTSLAFDTVFAEGQRRYVESLSTYARRFLGRMERAPLDSISGLLPAIAIDQRNSSRNPRSTVATVTEIHDVLRILYARVGIPHCVHCGREVQAQSPSEAARQLAAGKAGVGWLTTDFLPAKAPQERRDALVKDGWSRLWTTSGEIQLADERSLSILADGAELVVDRFNPCKAARARVAEAVAAAYGLGHGMARFRFRKESEVTELADHARCPDHGPVHSGELTPRHFSFNSQLGACSRCEGLGVRREIVADRLIADPEQGIWDALDGRVRAVLARSPRNRSLVRAVLESFDVTDATPAKHWSAEAREAILYGSEEQFTLTWTQRWGKTVRNVVEERPWPGVVNIVEGWRGNSAWLVAETECRACRGGRLQPELLAVTCMDLGIHAFCGLSVSDALARSKVWELAGARAVIAERAHGEIVRRLGFLDEVGLGYLALDRAADTLSGGEAQRIRLASQLGSRLTDVVYVLDEPTIGLHPRDTQRLLGTLEDLRDLGNTLVVVEHDPETIARADHVIDLGPGAGVHGGHVVAAGTPDQLAKNPASVTGPWLAGRTMKPRGERRKPRSKLVLKEATGNNLRGDTLDVPTGMWVGISGVSGSGKSTLIMDTLAPALQAHLGQAVLPLKHQGLSVGEKVDRVVVVDQSPIGRTPRSTAATYCGVLDKLRSLFSQTPGARARGWKPGRFSFNSTTGGRCTTCEGRGAILIEMHFLPDVWVQCGACRGSRYGRETLAVRFKGHSIADVLALPVNEALDVFTNVPGIKRALQALSDVGLGYLVLGQPATTLSGGEAQRVKLASELVGRRGHCVYVLDEPTTGLHLNDVEKLVTVLHRLVDKGHTVLTIEHHVELLRQVDWLIELGPDGGDAGGQIIAAGTPEAVVAAKTATGVALA
jgi:excinuclease ABC subunit A